MAFFVVASWCTCIVCRLRSLGAALPSGVGQGSASSASGWSFVIVVDTPCRSLWKGKQSSPLLQDVSPPYKGTPETSCKIHHLIISELRKGEKQQQLFAQHSV